MGRMISCRTCDRPLHVPDDLAGRPMQCPYCQATFTARPAARRSEEEEDRPRRRDDDLEEEDRADDRDRKSRRRRLTPHRGDTIQVLGILSFFLAPVIMGPIVWVMSNNDLAEMDAGRIDPEGRSKTQTGRLCGIIATIL